MKATNSTSKQHLNNSVHSDKFALNLPIESGHQEITSQSALIEDDEDDNDYEMKITPMKVDEKLSTNYLLSENQQF